MHFVYYAGISPIGITVAAVDTGLISQQLTKFALRGWNQIVRAEWSFTEESIKLEI